MPLRPSFGASLHTSLYADVVHNDSEADAGRLLASLRVLDSAGGADIIVGSGIPGQAAAYGMSGEET
jgi:hypothetical protein